MFIYEEKRKKDKLTFPKRAAIYTPYQCPLPFSFPLFPLLLSLSSIPTSLSSQFLLLYYTNFIFVFIIMCVLCSSPGERRKPQLWKTLTFFFWDPKLQFLRFNLGVWLTFCRIVKFSGDMEGIPQPISRTVEDVFNDFKGRRAGLVKALTTGSFYFPSFLAFFRIILCLMV